MGPDYRGGRTFEGLSRRAGRESQANSRPTTTSVWGQRILRTGQEMNIEDSLKRVPTYTEVVASYKFDILKPRGDVQFTASGDLALTAYGDLKRGDDRFNAMQNLVVRWCFNAP